MDKEQCKAKCRDHSRCLNYAQNKYCYLHNKIMEGKENGR